jgi:transcriptional regulator with XRE-family HTH domain
MPPKTLTVDELFSRRLREIREQQGLTQAELAERMKDLGTPIDRLTILKIERAGRPDAKGTSRRVSIGEALAFASALNTSPFAFLFPVATLEAPEAVQIGHRQLDREALIRWITGEAELSEEAAVLEQKFILLERQLDELRDKVAATVKEARSGKRRRTTN